MRRVGHKGADLIAPGNTVASFDAALEAGVDMIEFDVLPERRDGTGELLLAHDYEDLAARRATVLTLDEGLAHFCGDAYGDVDLNVDLKLPGYELPTIAAIRRHALARRVLVSTMERASLRVLRAEEPDIRLGRSVPRVRSNPFDNPLLVLPAYVGVRILRLTLPRAISRAIRDREYDAVMANIHVLTPKLVRAVLDAGGEIYVWTVDEEPRIAELRELGVTGVISNDPRILQAPRTTQVAAE